jgi:hypothetical protein
MRRIMDVRLERASFKPRAVDGGTLLPPPGSPQTFDLGTYPFSRRVNDSILAVTGQGLVPIDPTSGESIGAPASVRFTGDALVAGAGGACGDWIPRATRALRPIQSGSDAGRRRDETGSAHSGDRSWRVARLDVGRGRLTPHARRRRITTSSRRGRLGSVGSLVERVPGFVRECAARVVAPRKGWTRYATADNGAHHGCDLCGCLFAFQSLV